MKKTLLALVAVIGLLSASAHAAPVLLGEITHDYGSAAGKVDPGGNDVLSADYVTVADSSTSRFNDVFDFSGLNYNSIDHFALTLNFSNTNDINWVFIFPFLEDWNVRLGNSSQEQQLNRVGSTITSQTFTFNASVDTFANAVSSGLFTLWFAEEALGANSFRLYDATLDVYGVAAPATTNVPEPGTLALLGIGLLGGIALRRKA